MHFMLPSKRAAGGVEVSGAGEPEALEVKKPRVDRLVSSAAGVAAAEEMEVDNNNGGGRNNNDGCESNANGVNGGVGNSEVNGGGGGAPDIDEDLHSRQLAVYGRETMRRLFASNVLVRLAGPRCRDRCHILATLGVVSLNLLILLISAAKNLVLAGVKSVTLHDEGAVELWDLCGNFFFSEEDVGKNRALACVQKLQELNNAVVISVLMSKLSKEQLSDYQAVVFTDLTLEEAIKYNDYCHNHQPPISFIKSEVRGLFGNIFCDFGPEFTVVDVDGEEPHTGIIASISNDNPALVSCVDDERLEFQDGDLVVFSEVEGMTELNDGKPRKASEETGRGQIFVVGSGALGCEFLKNLALMGVCCSRKGKLTITDDDVIEKSNLSRQFLFRDWNIGQAKSTVAATAARVINPALHIEALQNRAGPETENVFDDSFWENLNVVINALDNVNARMYMDLRCLYFQKPLLESGTLGAKCNTQMVLPHLTENYGASRDPPEKQAPMCTVHSFPHNIDHCLTWARSEFEGLLEKTPNEVNSFLSNPSEYASSMRKAGDAQARDLLEHVLECLDKEKCETFQDCITWARLKFEDYYSNRVKQLTFTFPEDSVTSTGAPFWSAPKRFPRPLQFSTGDQSHLNFILAASILRAETFGISVPDWAKNPKKLADAIDKILVPDFQPKQGVKIETDEKATSMAAASVDDTAIIGDLIAKVQVCSTRLPSGFRMNPIQFEKDDDTNYHMDLIAGLANMRARNYSIPEVDKLKAKFIAGRIIPAIATSTAMATGLVCLELYKVVAGGHKVEDYRNTFANLALPLFSMAEPVPPKVFKHRDMTWTVWDRWVVRENLTLREFREWLKAKGLNAYSISCGTSLLYNSMFPRHNDRLDRKVVDVAREVSKIEVPSYRRHLDVVVACEDDDENDVDIPLVSIYFR
ncbi:Ubiquitin-activating enzyme E1 1 [Acorus calamus]|uniref:E1 ubiquitin-activating enzyme n=1 Tax=Acorus calamus TaxID=4465 RepID=A0AAV9FG30_ACOCL|nr:Ubiquitin-activating enzyme E1 1 [Acorus calamus]